MIWNIQSQARSTHHHSENVSSNTTDVMQPEVGVISWQQQPQGQQQVVALRDRLVPEQCQKSSINESYYNLDKILSWIRRFKGYETKIVRQKEEKKKVVRRSW